MGLGTHIPNGNSCGLWPLELKRLMWAELNQPNKNSIIIGSHNGASELAIGIVKDYKNDKSNIISVDICFGDYYELNRNRLKNKLGIELVKWEMDSRELKATYELWTNESVGLAFLDGFHSFEFCISDFEQVKDHLIKDSIIAFHDCSPRFPKRGLHEIPATPANGKEDFLVDESVSAILFKYDYMSEIDLKLGLECYHPAETQLSDWVRGTTSPKNSLYLIKHD